MSEADRRDRARARSQRMILHRAHLARRERDLDPIRGEAALSLVTTLTRESWSAAGLPEPTYSRAKIPIQFVRGCRG